MKLSKKDIKHLYTRCLHLVKTKPPEFFGFRKMRGSVGLCYWTDIELDYRRDLVGTAFHELIHYIHPQWPETSVLYAESRIINACSSFEIATFLKHLANKLYKAEMTKYNHQAMASKKSPRATKTKEEPSI